MHYVYVIESQHKKYLYVGITNNLQKRVAQHQNGKSKTTRSYRPFKLKHVETFLTRAESRAREKYLKSGAGKEWLKEF